MSCHVIVVSVAIIVIIYRGRHDGHRVIFGHRRDSRRHRANIEAMIVIIEAMMIIVEAMIVIIEAMMIIVEVMIVIIEAMMIITTVIVVPLSSSSPR